jgi:hypothetical protein
MAQKTFISIAEEAKGGLLKIKSFRKLTATVE